MPDVLKPTNEQIVKMLDQIMRQLSDMKSDQQQLSAELGKLAKTLKR